MKIYVIYQVDWTNARGEYKTVVDVYLHHKDASEAREVLEDEFGFTDEDHGTDYEIEERDLK